MKKNKIKNIYFVCSGNTCRSPMAEAILKSLLKSDTLNILSCGLYTDNGSEISISSKKIISEKIGIDYSSFRSTCFNKNMISPDTIFITMTAAHKNIILSYNKKAKVYTLKELAGEYGDIIDPFGRNKSYYSKTFDEIFNCLKKSLKKIKSIIKGDLK